HHPSLFGFPARNLTAATDVSINWSRRFSLFFTLRAGYQLLRQTSRITPYFANRTDVSGTPGIAANTRDPVDWAPPSLTFAGGMTGLSDAAPLETETETHNFSSEAV